MAIERDNGQMTKRTGPILRAMRKAGGLDPDSNLRPDLALESAGPGFGVYVHWPFCAAKCPYCDFNSHVRHGGVDAMGFADAICRELETLRGRTGPRDVDSIFFGGGTPSLMPDQAVAQILDRIGALWTCRSDVEVTLEANPTSVEAERFRGYRDAGVNRVSLGVQSLRDSDLQALGRLHSAQEAKQAIALAQGLFPRMSFDIIYARMGQSLADWRSELSEVLSLAGEHLSLYQLTIEPDTPFAALHDAGKLVVPDTDLARDLFDLTQEMTDRAGLPAYEISNHARPGAECRHNLVYWRCGDYVGVGPGAHGRITEDGVRIATATARNPEAWRKQVEQRGDGLTIDEPLDAEEIADEFLVMGLRLSEGIDPARYQVLAGRPFDPGRIADLKAHGLIAERANGHLAVTPEGFPVLNAVVADLAADALTDPFGVMTN
jgi:putative oxygen-independent coproporphyrinogen III oxidase